MKRLWWTLVVVPLMWLFYPKGLKAANSRDSFQSIEGIPYLAHIDKLRKEKFLELFTDLRAF